MQSVVLPQAMKRMLPALVNQSIIQLKNTSLLSILAVPDLLYQGQTVAHETYRPLEVYTRSMAVVLFRLFSGRLRCSPSDSRSHLASHYRSLNLSSAKHIKAMFDFKPVTDYSDGIYAIDSGYVRPHLDAIYLMVEQGRAALIDTGTNHSLPAVLAALHGCGLITRGGGLRDPDACPSRSCRRCRATDAADG